MCDWFGSDDSQPATQTIVNSSSIPQWAQDAAKENLQTAKTIQATPYQTYGGTRVTPFSTDRTNAFDMIRGNTGAWEADFNNATTAANAGAGRFTGANVSDYMNPYVQNVIDQINRQGQQQRIGVNAAATKAGGLNGARHGVVEAMQRDNESRQVGQAMADAFTNAQAQFNTDQGRQLSAAGLLQQLGQQKSAMGLQDAIAVGQIGEQQEAKTQQGLDTSYADFLEQRDYPIKMLNLGVSTLAGSPMDKISTQTGPASQTNSGSTAAQVLGGFGALAGGVGMLTGNKGIQSLWS